MACRYYEDSPGYYGSCKKKRALEREERGGAWERESAGYIDWKEWKQYNCESGDTDKCKRCPNYRA